MSCNPPTRSLLYTLARTLHLDLIYPYASATLPIANHCRSQLGFAVKRDRRSCRSSRTRLAGSRLPLQKRDPAEQCLLGKADARKCQRAWGTTAVGAHNDSVHNLTLCPAFVISVLARVAAIERREGWNAVWMVFLVRLRRKRDVRREYARVGSRILYP
jgi:hypothetical protein